MEKSNYFQITQTSYLAIFYNIEGIKSTKVGAEDGKKTEI